MHTLISKSILASRKKLHFSPAILQLTLLPVWYLMQALQRIGRIIPYFGFREKLSPLTNLIGYRKDFSDSSKKGFVPYKTTGTSTTEDEEDVLEIYDLPVEAQYEEDPEFEYISQSMNERRYPFISETRAPYFYI